MPCYAFYYAQTVLPTFGEPNQRIKFNKMQKHKNLFKTVAGRINLMDLRNSKKKAVREGTRKER